MFADRKQAIEEPNWAGLFGIQPDRASSEAAVAKSR
jgi:hypothetical protein